MTNREYLDTLTDEELYDMWLFIIYVYSKGFTLSKVGVVDWLKKPYDKDEWIWKRGSVINE